MSSNAYVFPFLHLSPLGRGTVFFIDVTPQGVQPVRTFDWNDGLFDITWSENNEHLAVTGSGDGSLQVWDVAQQKVCNNH